MDFIRQIEQSPLVLEAFTRYLIGETIRKIVDWLNGLGIKSSHGIPVSINNVTTMLKHRAYIGKYHYADVMIKDAIPQIVPLDYFCVFKSVWKRISALLLVIKPRTIIY